MTPSKFLVIAVLGFFAGTALTFIIPLSLFGIGILVTCLIVASLISGMFESTKGWAVTLFGCALLLGIMRTFFPGVAAGFDGFEYAGRVQEFFVSRIEATIPGDEAAIFSAMVLGYEEHLSTHLKEAFNRTGTRHILAISGMNMTIVAALVINVLVTIGLWRRKAFYATLFILAAYTLLIGLPPSAVRASIMAALYLLAYHVGRPVQVWRMLLVAGALMVLVHPAIISSLSFQLSFLAVLGIAFFKEFFDAVLRWLPMAWLRELLSMSLAAQVATLPLIAYTFENVSVIGIIANIVVVPALPLIMILGLGFLTIGWAHEILAPLFLWPAWVLLHVVSGAVEWFSSLSFAAISISWFGLGGFILYYELLLALYLFFMRRYAHDHPA